MRKLQVVRGAQKKPSTTARRPAVSDAPVVTPYVRARSSRLVHLTADVASTRFNGVTATSLCGVWVGHNPELLEEITPSTPVCRRCRRETDR